MYSALPSVPVAVASVARSPRALASSKAWAIQRRRPSKSPLKKQAPASCSLSSVASGEPDSGISARAALRPSRASWWCPSSWSICAAEAATLARTASSSGSISFLNPLERRPSLLQATGVAERLGHRGHKCELGAGCL